MTLSSRLLLLALLAGCASDTDSSDDLGLFAACGDGLSCDDEACVTDPVCTEDSPAEPCPAGDGDGDGVCDSDDVCPMDNPDDSDGDGVCDSADVCPMDNPDDSDGDGVCDSDDVCPMDNPDDSDGDGVCDSDDVCPGFDDAADIDGDGEIDGCQSPRPLIALDDNGDYDVGADGRILIVESDNGEVLLTCHDAAGVVTMPQFVVGTHDASERSFPTRARHRSALQRHPCGHQPRHRRWTRLGPGPFRRGHLLQALRSRWRLGRPRTGPCAPRLPRLVRRPHLRHERPG